MRRWCDQHVPEQMRDQARVECEEASRHLTILERRPPWSPDIGPEWTSFPVARLRYTRTTGVWELYWRDRNLRFHRYDLVPPSANVTVLLDAVDGDPTGIFWG